MAEFGEKKEDIPEGFLGNLNDKQDKGLKEIWEKFLELIDDDKDEVAGVKAEKGADDDVDQADEDDDGEDAFKGKAKDDDAKDEEAKKREQKELAALLGEYGAKKFHEEFWNAARGENPDSLMLRFCRARKWDIDRAFAMLCASIKWRIEQGVAEIKEKGELGLCDEDGFRMQYDKGKSYIHGTDRHDRPVVYIHVAKHKPKEQSQKALQRFTIFNMETAKVLQTPKARGQGTLVFDMTGFGLSNMDWACIKFILECFEARYPETLGLCIVHKAPMVFSAIWAILKPLLDPVVRSKVDFTSSESDLAKHIDPKHIKKAMGGELAWEWRYTGPDENENDIMKDEEGKKEKMKAYEDICKRWEENTREWVKGSAGSDDKERIKLGKEYMIRNLDLDPYVRGQTVYSRTGVNTGDGRVIWNYEGNEEEFGQNYNLVREEMGIEGKCPKYGSEGNEQADADAIDPDAAAAFAAGKTGSGPIGKLRRRSSNAASKFTPGPSDEQKARKEAEDEKAALQERAEEAKKKRQEEEKAEQERQAKEEEEAKKAEGYLASISAAGAAVLGKTAEVTKSVGHVTSNYVPSALGGDKLAEATAPADAKDAEE